MKNGLILAILTVFMVGLIASCTKKDTVPASPIVGQWDLNRYIVSDTKPTSYSANNRSVPYNAVQDGQDSYTFKGDGTFVSTYQNAGIQTVNGTWSLSGTILTVTYVASSGASADVFTYSSTANELTGNKYLINDQVTNPTTKVVEPISYNVTQVYKLKQ